MAISEHVAGSQTATVGTEHTLNTTTPETTDGVFQFFVDISALVGSEVVELRVKEKTRAADTQRLVWSGSWAAWQAPLLVVSPTLILLHGWDFTLKQVGGTGRAFPFSVRKVA